jgi:hypothetical protein
VKHFLIQMARPQVADSAAFAILIGSVQDFVPNRRLPSPGVRPSRRPYRREPLVVVREEYIDDLRVGGSVYVWATWEGGVH